MYVYEIHYEKYIYKYEVYVYSNFNPITTSRSFPSSVYLPKPYTVNPKPQP